MNVSPLPPELDALESQLRQLPGHPLPELRSRVLLGIAQELWRQHRHDWYGYAMGVAAMLVLWANLSWTVSRDTSYDWHARGSNEVTVEQIEKLLPGVSKGEARRQAMLLGGGRRSQASVGILDPSSAPRPANRGHCL